MVMLDTSALAAHIQHMQMPEEPWPTGAPERLEPLVARVLAPNPSRFTYTGTQTYLVGDDRGVAVIDPGPAEPDHLAALEAAIGDTPLVAIACTHTHRDHSPAAAPLAERTGAPIIGCAALVPTGGGAPTGEEPFDTSYRPTSVLADGEAISGPGFTLIAVATPGHTSNHLCFALEESGALFTGDHVMGWSTSVVVPPDGDMGQYMASLDKLRAREDRVFYPAHGPAVERPAKLLRGLIAHRRQRERQITRLLEERGPLAIVDMVPEMYAAIDRALWPAAGMSVNAHLVELERQGRVTREDERWMIA